jgi:hypothetical protein
MRPDLPSAPLAIQALPCDERGFPIPWFVHIDENGQSDFRVIGFNKQRDALRQNLCWICGRKLRRVRAFVIGPMCVVNRVSAEPPSHPECADFAAKACPFLTRPLAKRNEHGLERHQTVAPPGIMISRNPGVTVIWWTLRFSLLRTSSGPLCRIGQPERVQWFAHGRPATRDEALESMASGLPTLREMAKAEGPAAIHELAEAYFHARLLVPEAA